MSQQMSAPEAEGRIIHHPKKSVLSTPNPFEKRFGYHRAVKRGPFIFVSGTTAAELVDTAGHAGDDTSSRVHYPGDAFKQAEFAMYRCQLAVEALGGVIEDIVRVKMYVANFEDCGLVGDAFKAVFGASNSKVSTTNSDDVVGAAATMIVVPGGFVDKNMLVEIEVDAYCL